MKAKSNLQIAALIVVALVISGHGPDEALQTVLELLNTGTGKVIASVLAVIAVIVVMNYSYLNGVLKLLKCMVIAKTHDRKHRKGLYSFLDTFEEKVDSDKTTTVQFIVAETGEQVTLTNLDKLANQVGHWGLSKGLKQQDTVALMLLNTSDYVALWLGFGKIGVSTALLNTNLTGNAFVHSCEVSLKNSDGAKILIVDSDLKKQLSSDLSKLESSGIKVYYWSSSTAVESVKHEVVQQSSRRVPRSHRDKVNESDALLFIFTSGTTGLPKACKISQTRMFLSTIPFRVLCSLTPEDRVYTVLPLYHSGGGMLGVGGCLMAGATMVLRKKFSASNFTTDCLKYKITSFQYIGELCRYLTALPPNEKDATLTSIRTAYGNGMRPDVWEVFQKRYNIGHIVEFYGATEGNATLFNCFDKVGALGHIPPLLDAVYPLRILRTDQDDRTKPLRDVATGRCVQCEAGEVGLLVSQIFTNRKFEGYTDEKATNDKILKGVFKDGDAFFNTGDLLSRDAAGYYYWSDRIGDTFRWKGENVATTEVSEVLAQCQGVRDVTVYGVSVPGCDGRAGMACIAIHTTNADNTGAAAAAAAAAVVESGVMLRDVVKQCKTHLPAYSRPLFLRVKVNGESLETTSTFKHVKGALTTEGFNPAAVKGDVVYYYQSKTESYAEVTPQVYEDILAQKIRF